ncbi:DJ-1/PfpI family protein [Roseomonas terrae]|uniref:DJ-1/PfpI family protein n=1 Tax=Neoroseomonas terrae TaxID=424799 RepID=A0ABS5EC78_9PROT|nr:DJ-1/PfpI family protein [Neoroseomonas terrae]MBR0648628.1 DJ-1/PfpI family protein [Neoroseomonas terrae]
MLASPRQPGAQSASGGRQAGSASQPAAADAPRRSKKIGVVIFAGFEALDVYGPVQMWGRLPDHEVVMVAEDAGPVKSSQGAETVADFSFANAPPLDVFMVPGGIGTRREVNNPAMLEFLRRQDSSAEWTTSVCTGSAVLAKAGILAGRRATTNKRAWAWATSQDQSVLWQGRARWVTDGKYVTSSGISAGTDMALGFVELLYGRALAERIAHGAEYMWNDDPNNDPFTIE